MVPELIPVLGSQPAGDVSNNPGGRSQYFPPGLQLPVQPLRGLLPILLLGEQRHNGCEQFAKTTSSGITLGKTCRGQITQHRNQPSAQDLLSARRRTPVGQAH